MGRARGGHGRDGASGHAAPDATLASIRRTRCALKAPITTPVGSGFRSINVHLRQELGLFACIRPCKHYPGVRTFFSDLPVDLVIVRENTEDLYAGIEFAAGLASPANCSTISTGFRPSERFVRAARPPAFRSSRSAFGQRSDHSLRVRVCRENGRSKVTAVHKANIMKHTDGLFLDTARTVAQEFPDIAFEDRIVDNMCMQLVQKPELYDVLVLPNLYGDILSDLAAGLVGGLGVAAGANIGPSGAVFEATHGSAPKYKGQNKVNPTALILSGMLMLRHLKENEAATRLEKAVAAVIAEGKEVTYDMKAQPRRSDGRRHPRDGRGDLPKIWVRDAPST